MASALLDRPFAGCIFVLSMLHKSGEPQHFEAMKGCLISSLICTSVSLKLQGMILGVEAQPTDWVTPGPEDLDTVGALVAGCVFGLVGTGGCPYIIPPPPPTLLRLGSVLL